MEVTGIKIKTTKGPVYVLSIYCSPTARVTLNHWLELLGPIPQESGLLLMGDFNAHLPYLEPFKSNRAGRVLLELKN